ERVKQGIRWLRLYAHIVGLTAAGILFFAGSTLAGLFNEDTMVRTTAAAYLMIVPIGYGLYGCGQVGASILNVYHKPFLAGALSLIQIALVAVPLAYLLPRALGVNGVFAAILISFAVIGILSFIVVGRESKTMIGKTAIPVRN
ncbi:MAG: hypothetical protein PQJ61_09225, partial [Spirochaetales bacterium]|nr:hypothetical protein [Spirochaetales bacterium]